MSDVSDPLQYAFYIALLSLHLAPHRERASRVALMKLQGRPDTILKLGVN